MCAITLTITTSQSGTARILKYTLSGNLQNVTYDGIIFTNPVGIFYLDDLAALTVRLYGVSGKTIRLYAENNAVSFTELREYTR